MIRQRSFRNRLKSNDHGIVPRIFQTTTIFITLMFHLSFAYAVEETVRETEETPAAMVEALQQRSTLIDQRENLLKEREARLHLLEDEIRGMIREFSKLKEEVDQKEGDRLNALNKEEEKRLTRLAKIYQSMTPKEAADRIARLKDTTVLNLLRRIKAKAAANILSNMSPAKAARFSEKFVRVKK